MAMAVGVSAVRRSYIRPWRRAGFKWRYSYMTTSQLFDKNGTTADAEKYFQVLSADKGRNKGYEPGDILMFRGNGKKAGQHVGIFGLR